MAKGGDKKPKKAGGVIVPVFSEVASVQKSLAKRYRAEAEKVARMLNGYVGLSNLLGTYHELAGEDAGKSFEYQVVAGALVASPHREENGYVAPQAAVSIALRVGDEEKALYLTASVDGLYRIRDEDGVQIVETPNLMRAVNSLEGELIANEEKLGFSSREAINKRAYEYRQAQQPRYEHK